MMMSCNVPSGHRDEQYTLPKAIVNTIIAKSPMEVIPVYTNILIRDGTNCNETTKE
jgi:hypothetical protein